MNIRLLKAEEIEVRIGTINEKGATLLLYKDARVDQHILDETFSPFGWQRDHKELKGNVYCGIGIKDPELAKTNDQWVWKWDAGSESNTEAVKGEASDSFKRAAVNWGIGRELYTSPFIWITADKYKSFTNKSGKLSTYDKFSVEKIQYDEATREITGLSIRNDSSDNRIFLYVKDNK